MNQEEKELLFKDLSARLYFGVKVKIVNEDSAIESGTLVGMTRATKHDAILYEDLVCLKGVLTPFRIEEVRPYLRPFTINCMSKEEVEEFLMLNAQLKLPEDKDVESLVFFTRPAINWLKANHFDYNCLIPKGLAIKFTEENNPYNI